MNNKNIILIRIQVNDTFYIGPGKISLLEAILDTGSISSAAKKIGMSYRKAWKLIKDINESSLEKIVITSTGGKGTGGAFISTKGQKFINSFRKIEKKVFLETEKEKNFIYDIFID